MKNALLAFLLVLATLGPLASVNAGHSGPGTHFGPDGMPAGCSGNGPPFHDGCHHMRTQLNRLDTPIIDVLLVPPVSTYPERDLRTMRQAIEMWDAGIRYLAADMGLDWLSSNVEFNIFLDDDEFTTHPLWDPEIIVVATNPVGGVGIGIDPFGLKGPCKGANPLAGLDAWENLPGFDSHHDGHGGTYVETCEGGGTTCYAVNLAIDPAPGFIQFFGLFYLVAHEVGHCLSVGHVGDGLDFDAANVPRHDIMSYAFQGDRRCVSTLDVESFALRMSQYLLPTPLAANDGLYQTMHPNDYRFATSDGTFATCPLPNWNLIPGQPTDYWPSG